MDRSHDIIHPPLSRIRHRMLEELTPFICRQSDPPTRLDVGHGEELDGVWVSLESGKVGSDPRRTRRAVDPASGGLVAREAASPVVGASRRGDRAVGSSA